ncbi:MAG: thiamine-phosphate kinase [Mariprofundaceae bacterium]|nr:thiamine-phosphate kinase [Mariprofundaceae bacterium]
MSVGEFDLIHQAFRCKAPFIHSTTRVANGDDASVHALPAAYDLVVSTDMSMAGVHWPHDFPLKDAACRAVNAALSDLAAMGAEAAWLWCCAAVTDVQAAEQMGEGIAAALANCGIELAGGDTVRADTNSLSVTVAGMLPEATAMRRDAACVGDDVWLCGHAGLAAYALQQWQQGQRSEDKIEAFRVITPQLDVGIAIREMGVRCCIDVSDGLLADAGHLAAASALSVEIEAEKVPGFNALCRFLSRNEAIPLLLTGGEDYALLFTASANFREHLTALATCIGRCTSGAGVNAMLDGKKIEISRRGYEHFS